VGTFIYSRDGAEESRQGRSHKGMMRRTGVVLALMHRLKILAPTVGAVLLVWGLLLAYFSSPAWASTITVNSLADDADGTDGECTLREAITSANTDTSSGMATGECAAGSGDDVIDIGVTGTVNLTRVLPDLSTSIQIEGPGADQLTVGATLGATM
jgi:CSLREA domain-containing protein